MRVHRDRNAPSNEFGRMLTRVLIGRGLDNDGLRKRLRDVGQRPSAEFVQMLCAGQRDPSPRLIEAVVQGVWTCRPTGPGGFTVPRPSIVGIRSAQLNEARKPLREERHLGTPPLVRLVHVC